MKFIGGRNKVNNMPLWKRLALTAVCTPFGFFAMLVAWKVSGERPQYTMKGEQQLTTQQGMPETQDIFEYDQNRINTFYRKGCERL